MKILVTDQGSYIHNDLVKWIGKIYGRDSVDELTFIFEDKNLFANSKYEELFLDKTRRTHYDAVITANFYPVVARLCYEKKITYIAWTYDTPMNVLPCDEMQYETNFIFVFDRIETGKFKEMGYERFCYMPLAVDPEKYEAIRPDKQYAGDVTFLGKLYRSKLPVIRSNLSDDLVKYIDELVRLQTGITDKYIVDDFISTPIINEINNQLHGNGLNIEVGKEQLSYAISEYVTYIDRMNILELLGKRFDTHLYTYDIGDKERQLLPDVKIHGALDYHTQVPSLYKSSKINLSSSLRAAQSAIPLRVLDILACRGFLLSNAQPEICEYFENEKEAVVFKSPDELIEYTEYYLKHEDERQRIAEAGLMKVKKAFRYEDRLKEMFRIAGI
jgi:spore maturation protein CgeB